MSELEALVLGVVQGLTEFLPVSSSGHLVMGETLMGVKSPGVVFEVAVHAATLVSVLLFYHRRVGRLLIDALHGQADALRYGAKLVLATIPAVLLVLAAGEFLEGLFDRPAVSGASLLVTGVLLWTTRRTVVDARDPEPGWTAVWWIGCSQALAIVPGISRSGTTVACGLALGVAPSAAAEFSFLMSVPAILGAVVRKAPELAAIPSEALLPLAVAVAAAGSAGIAAIWLFVRLLRSRAFYRFAYYTWTVGALFLAWLVLG